MLVNPSTVDIRLIGLAYPDKVILRLARHEMRVGINVPA
jgi:hypothetical protein